LRSNNETDQEVSQSEFRDAEEAIGRGQKWDVEELGGSTRRAPPQEETTISTGNKQELQDSEPLKKLIPEAEERGRFMKWLQKNHQQGESGPETKRETERHEHYNPGTKELEEAVRNWKLSGRE
jgi:hypothetical protein